MTRSRLSIANRTGKSSPLRQEIAKVGTHSEAADHAVSHAYHSYVDIGWACILAGSMCGLYFHAPSFSLGISIVTLGATAFLANKSIQTRAADWCMLLIVALEFGILFSSQYSSNSIRPMVLIALFVLTFFVVRVTIWRPEQIVWLGGVLGLGGACLGLNAMRQFNAETERLASVGFSNLLAFRSRLIAPPAPWIAGEWFTIILLGLPFACALPAYLWRRGRTWHAVVALLPLLVVTSALVLSLSRAVFWSTVLFYLSACTLFVYSKILSPRAGITLLAGAIGSFVLILACESALYPSLAKAYEGQHASQTRSTQGRVEIWSRSFELVKAHPLMGVGSANSALMLLSSADEEETIGFASRTFSLPIQILVEEGIIGFALYALFLVLVAREFIGIMRCSPAIREADKSDAESNRHVSKHLRTQGIADVNDDSAYKAMVCCFAAGLIAVLFRELTYSSVMEHSLTLSLVAVLAALICRPQGT